LKTLLVSLSCFFSIFVSAQEINQEKYLLDLSKRKFDWMVANQLDSLSMILDEKVLYIHSNGLIQKKEEMLESFKTGSLFLDSVKIMDAAVRMFGTTAIITGKGNFYGSMRGTPFQSILLYTEVYVNENQHWKLVSRHANKLQ
jgi:hypothetical protein